MEEAGDKGTQSRLRLAAEQLYEDTRLRDALDDEQASRLLAWGYQAIARATWGPEAGLEKASAAHIEERGKTVREVIGLINRLMDSYAQRNEAERQRQIAALRDWLCRVRTEGLTIGDMLRLETLPSAVDEVAPDHIFSLLLAALVGDEEA